MNILIVSQYFWPENFRINDLVRGLVTRGHRITVLTGQPNYPSGRLFENYGWNHPREQTFAGARVLRVPLVPRRDGGHLRLILNYLSFMFAASWGVFTRLNSRDRFDAIFVFEPSPVTVGVPAALARWRFKAPILFWVLDLWPESLSATGAISSPWILSLVDRGVRWIYAQCARILVQSRAFTPNIEKLGVPRERINYFPNWTESEYEGAGIDLDITNAAGLESEHSDEASLRIVYAGNIGVAQDFPTIIGAAEIVAKLLPRVRWIVAGDGRMGSWVRDEVARRGLNEQFKFLGQRPSVEMPELFSTADALLVTLRPAPIFAQTIPGKVQSYLAAGKPILAMLDGEGSRVIDESGGGLTCMAGDAPAMAQIVARLAAMSGLERQAMGEKGRDYAYREFGREMLFDRLESWLIKVVEECRNKE
ncbi:MAG: glycosyltransferase family 4 protein [Proteobacteria bacterium]|nr:glycosyltransferase family 4 protein [Pseudomonadota bacterium]